MDFINAVGATIVGEIAKYTFVPIGRQLGYLYHYRRNINNLSNQIQDLQKKKASIDDEVRKARKRGKEPTEEVEDWFTDVASQCEAGNEFLGSEDHAKAKCGLFPNLWLRRKLSREAQKMAQTIASVTEKASNLRNNISKIPSLRCSFNNRDFEDFDSREQTLEEIMEALKDPAHRMIGVYGDGGIGKTTLVTEAAKMAKKEGLFRKVAIVTLSQTFEVGVKQKEIAEKLGLEMPEETESARAERLKDGLRKQEKILIVLDDIWETKVPDLSKDFGIDFKDEQSDCKIILVSRDQSVLQNLMGVDKNIKLQFLTDHEAINLFKKFIGCTIHSGFESSASSLVKECGGLPIAIVTIACTLKNNRDIRVWKDILRKLKSSPREGYGKAYSSIKTSYDSLESDQAKMVLLLCSLHEEDANIRVDNLMSIHGAVCNLFHNMDTLEEARNSMHVLVERLKRRCLLLNGDYPDTVKMHDVIRDIMGSIAQEDKSMHCFADFSKFERLLEHGELKESHAISALKCDTDRFPEELACHKLELLLLAPEYSFYTGNRPSILVPDDWFKSAKELKALLLGSLILKPLPPRNCFLQKLQTLSLQNCKLDDIAWIGELKNLIVLDLSRSDFKLLPEQIKKLNRLRQLNLNRCSSLAVISPNVISSLVKLEELYMNSVGINWGRQVIVDGDLRINASLIELKNLKRLRDLHLYIKNPTVIPNDGFVRECLEKYRIIVGKDSLTLYPSNFSSLNSLIVHGCGTLKQLVPSGICGFLMQLERLEISDCPMMEELFAINEQGGGRSTQILLPKLKYLELENLASLKRFFSGDCMMECESLLELKIDNCPQLIPNSLHTSRSVDEEAQQPLLNDKVSFPLLQYLSVSECKSLKYLLSCSAATRLSELMYLKLESCDGIEEIIFVTENTTISFPKLQSVRLSSLGNLKRISSSNSCIIECPCLAKLKIRGCRGLGTSDIGWCRFTLIREEKHQVGEKASLADTQPPANEKVMLPIILKQLLQFSDQTSFKNLQKLEIDECHTLQCLFPYSTVESLAQLKGLEIRNCEAMEVVVTTTKALGEDQQGLRLNHDHHICFPKLESLTLGCLPKLKSFCEGDRIECPSLLTLEIIDCESLRTFVADSAHVQPVVEQEVGGIDLQVTQQPLFSHMVAFPRLQDLSVSGCRSLKYLLSCSAATRLSELMRLWLASCEGIEEIIFVTENTTISFPKLQYVGLWSLGNLTRISSSNSCIVECPCLEKLTLHDSSRLTLIREEKHQVGEKASIADTQPPANEKVMLPSTLKQLLQFSDQTSFRNLQVLEIDDCHTLLYLFPYSTVESLAQLKRLSIGDCEVMEVVVTTTKSLGEDQQGLRLNHDHHIFFPKLESLTLGKLPKLKSFCEGDRIECPSLSRLEIRVCESLRTFVADSAHIQSVVEQEVGGIDLQVTQQPLFNHMVAFSNLEELTLKGKWANDIWWRQSSSVLPFPKLKVIQSMCWEPYNQTSFVPFDIHIHQNIKKISLTNILVEKMIWQHQEENDHQIPQTFQNLETLTVTQCGRLRTLLISSSVSFTNLTSLEVSECHEMVNLLRASTAKTLVLLKKMSIYDCKRMTEVVIGNKKGEAAESSSGIVFSKLKTLALHGLPSLKSFHGGNTDIQFPLLKKVIVSKCPEMEIFSNGSTTTPKLNQVITKPEFSYFTDSDDATAIEEIWAGDLNGTVREIWEISFGIALQRLFSETNI